MTRATLYYSPNLNPRLCVAVARYLEADLNFVFAEPFHPDHQEHFRTLNPMTRVPILQRRMDRPCGEPSHQLPPVAAHDRLGRLDEGQRDDRWL